MDDDQRRMARARLLRRQGKTYAEIRAVIGDVSDDHLQAWLRGIPRPPETLRARAKDELRRECRRLRTQGLTYGEIAAKTGASQGSLSLWLSEQPRPQRVRDQAAHLKRIRPLAVAAHQRNAKRRQAQWEAAGAGAVEQLSERELFFAGVAIYWAEGSKDKPWRRSGRVVLINSDPGVLRLFLAWLDLLEVPEEQRCYRLNIHETADVAAQERWWSAELNVPTGLFARPTLKRHNPSTIRRNVDAGYHGCLVVSVRRSRWLYDVVAGGWRRMVESVALSTQSDDSPP